MMSLSRRGNPLFPTFTLEQYQANPDAIKKVNDAALEYLEVLRDKLDENIQLVKEKELRIVELQQIGIIDLIQPLFLLIASVMLAFGVNLATASPQEWYGWALSLSGCAVQLIVIFIALGIKMRRRTK